MSRIFKSPYITVVEKPLEVTLNEKEIKEALYKRKIENHQRSSDSKHKNHEETASNIIESANAEAAEILEKINEQAENMLAKAKMEADIIKANATKEGFSDGYQEGLLEGKRQTEDLAQQALMIKEELEAEREDLLMQVENQIPAIITYAVKKIIGKELKTNKEIIVGLVSEALEKINSQHAKIQVSSDDFEVLKDNRNEVLAGNKDISDIEINEDLSLKQGDCIIETNCGDVDASITTQIENLQVTIFDLVGNDENE